MKINKKGKRQEKFLGHNIYKDMIKREVKITKTALENNEGIRKISLPIRKNCFGSPKSKNLMINKTYSFQSNDKINNNDNLNFSFGKINHNKECNNIYLDRNKEMSFFDQKKKNKFLTEKSFNNENVSMNILFNKKIRKKNIIPKPSIKQCYFDSFINLDMAKKDYALKNDDILKKKQIIKNNNKPLKECICNCNISKGEKDLKIIEEFMGNLKSKERSESLKNAINMYKRYRSSSGLNYLNKLNYSCGDLNFSKKQLNKQKSDANLLTKNRIIDQFERKNNNNYINNKINNNKKIKKLFFRKIIKQENFFKDKNINTPFAEYKQSVLNNENRPIYNMEKDLDGKIIKKVYSHKCFKISKISRKKSLDLKNDNNIKFKINQRNNFSSFNNINSINNLNNINKNINIKIEDGKNNISPKSRNKLRIINLTKKITKDNKLDRIILKNNTKNYPKKIKLIKYSNKNNYISNRDFPFEKKDYNNNNYFQRNYSYQNIYKSNENKFYNELNNNSFFQSNYNSNYNDIYKNNYQISRYNNYINNYNTKRNFNDYNGNYYKKESYPEKERTFLLSRNNSNCSFYESKSITNNSTIKNNKNKSYIIFKRNKDYDIDYIKTKNYNTNNPNYYNENINLNNNNYKLNQKFISYDDYNNHNNRNIYYNESCRMPYYY